jgi:hypothetical protein
MSDVCDLLGSALAYCAVEVTFFIDACNSDLLMIS